MIPKSKTSSTTLPSSGVGTGASGAARAAPLFEEDNIF